MITSFVGTEELRKVLNLDWFCDGKKLQFKTKPASILLAKIVIRKQSRQMTNAFNISIWVGIGFTFHIHLSLLKLLFKVLPSKSSSLRTKHHFFFTSYAKTSATLTIKLSKLLQLFNNLKHLNFLFSQKSLPSYGAFAALKRYSILSQLLYPQYITWNRILRSPERTPKFKLIPWFLLSILVLSVNLSFFYVGFREILAHQKDPKMSSVHILLLAMYTSGFLGASAATLSFVLEGDGLVFVLRNLKTIRVADGMSNRILKKSFQN